jgi:hypothetical protein
MKRIVSISLGSSKRDKKVTASFFGEQFQVDGKIEAFGVGGCDVYLYAGSRRYVFREAIWLMEGAKRTPYFDGSGLKHTLERETVAYLDDNKIVDFPNSRVLLVSAVDRFGMAEALSARAKSIVFRLA